MNAHFVVCCMCAYYHLPCGRHRRHDCYNQSREILKGFPLEQGECVNNHLLAIMRRT